MNKKEILQKEVEELRKERNQYQQIVCDIQAEIDKKMLEMSDVPDYTGKYVLYEDDFSEIFIKVDSYSRAFDGVLFEGKIFIIEKDTKYLTCSDTYTIDYNYISNVNEIRKEDFIESLNEKFFEILDKL